MPILILTLNTCQVERTNGSTDIAFLHAPGQLLAKANWVTITSKWADWAFLTALGCGKHVGGDTLKAATDNVKFCGLTFCSDALITNNAILKRQRFAWQQLRDAGNAAAKATALLSTNCAHHQGSLVQRPIILSVPNLVTFLVRMCHMFAAHSFQTKMSKVIPEVMKTRFSRRVVIVLPPGVEGWRRRNLHFLQKVAPTLDAKLMRLVIIVFNHDWSDPDNVIHWCNPDCQCLCLCDSDALALATDIAMQILMAFPDAPLLYRWKHFTEANSYALVGKALHNLLPTVVIQVQSRLPPRDDKDAANDDADEKDENLSFASKQQIRANKTIKYLLKPDCLRLLAIASCASEPIATYLGQVSLADTCQQHFQDKLRQCRHTFSSDEFESEALHKLNLNSKP